MIKQIFSSLKRRVLNLFLLEYTLGELWQLFRLQRTQQLPIQAHPTHHWPTSTDLLRHIFVISLPFRADRRANIAKQFAQVNLPYILIDAVHGKELELNQVSERILSPTAKKYLSTGSLGCALSHLSVWQEMQKQALDYALIFEDDVVLDKDFTYLLKAWMPEIPTDFDILFLGSGKTGCSDISYFTAPHVFVPAYPREGLYGYVLSKHGVQQLLDYLFPIHLASGGIDTMVGKLVRKGKLRAYHVLPVLCRADMESASNIANPMDQHKLLDARE